jgi:hypothetical protein
MYHRHTLGAATNGGYVERIENIPKNKFGKITNMKWAPFDKKHPLSGQSEISLV